MALNDEEREFLARLTPALPVMEDLLRRLVVQGSFTTCREGVDRVGDLLGAELGRLGFRISELISGRTGRTLVARREAEGSHRLLLLGHLDTAHPPASPFQGYRRLEGEGGRATGPGVADMKGGLVVILQALRALEGAGRLRDRHVTVVLGADEEAGSPTSADLIRAEAADAHLCLCFEAGRPRDDGSSTIVTRRKGFGRFTVEARGEAAHAGVEPERGRNAIVELARMAVAFHEHNDPEAGVSVNVGVFHGGTSANTVPAEASMEVDYRFPDEEARRSVEGALLWEADGGALRGAGGTALVSTRIRDHVRRPAMERSEAMARMARRIIAWGGELGLSLVEEARGGSSDAALATEMGCPAICGLGVVGDAFHTRKEWIRVSSLMERAQLAALTVHRFFGL